MLPERHADVFKIVIKKTHNKPSRASCGMSVTTLVIKMKPTKGDSPAMLCSLIQMRFLASHHWKKYQMPGFTYG